MSSKLAKVWDEVIFVSKEYGVTNEVIDVVFGSGCLRCSNLPVS